VNGARLAQKIRFEYEDLECEAEGDLDRRGRMGLAEVPVHYSTVRLTIRIKTEESDKKLERLKELVAHYCPVDSLIRAAVPDYTVTWERM
jgi:putative redox protein